MLGPCVISHRFCNKLPQSQYSKQRRLVNLPFWRSKVQTAPLQMHLSMSTGLCSFLEALGEIRLPAFPGFYRPPWQWLPDSILKACKDCGVSFSHHITPTLTPRFLSSPAFKAASDDCRPTWALQTPAGRLVHSLTPSCYLKSPLPYREFTGSRSQDLNILGGCYSADCRLPPSKESNLILSARKCFTNSLSDSNVQLLVRNADQNIVGVP